MRTELKKDEKVILITRPHWFTMVLKFLFGLIGIAVGITFMFFALAIVGIPVAVVSAVYLSYKMLERNRNIWAVTNMRVIDEEGVFSSETKESPLDKINNVSYSQSFWGKIFGYGNVDIQTAAEIGETRYNNVEKPGKLKDAITTMQEEYKKMQMKNQAKEFAYAIGDSSDNDIGTELEKLNKLKETGVISDEEFQAGKKKLLD